MSLTVMMIAKDEAGVIGRAIDSVKGVADEILIADTGSVDETREVARAHGATVFDFKWTDDFSAARNFVVEKSRGDWVMGMDADEELLVESVPVLKAAMGNEEALGYFVTLRNLDDVNRPEVFTEMHSMRIMRRVPGAKFVGRIHEHIDPPIGVLMEQTGQRILQSGIYLRHTGFVQALKQQKLARAAGLLELELRERPGQLYYMIEHGRTLIQLGNMSGVGVLVEAAKQVWAVKDEARAPLPSVALLLEFAMLGAKEGIKGGPIGEEEAMWLAEKWFPTSAPLMWLKANRLFARGQFGLSAKCLESLVEMGRTGNYDRTINFDPRILRADAMLNLGACYLRMGELDRSERYLRAVAGDETVGLAARKNLEILEGMKGKTA